MCAKVSQKERNRVKTNRQSTKHIHKAHREGVFERVLTATDDQPDLLRFPDLLEALLLLLHLALPQLLYLGAVGDHREHVCKEKREETHVRL